MAPKKKMAGNVDLEPYDPVVHVNMSLIVTPAYKNFSEDLKTALSREEPTFQQPLLGIVASYLTTDDAALVAQLVGPIIEATFEKGGFDMDPQVPVHVIHALKINNRLMETWGLATVIADGTKGFPSVDSMRALANNFKATEKQRSASSYRGDFLVVFTGGRPAPPPPNLNPPLAPLRQKDPPPRAPAARGTTTARFGFGVATLNGGLVIQKKE